MKQLLFITLALVMVAATLTGCNQLSASAQPEPEPEPDTSGQTVLYGKVKAANGNEVTLALGIMGGADTTGFAGDGRPGGFSEQSLPAELPEGFSPPSESFGAMPEGARQSRLSGGEASGEIPEGFTPPANASGDVPAGGRGQNGNRQSNTGGEEQSGSTGQTRQNASDNTGQSGAFPSDGNMTDDSTSLEYTGEEATFQIPVTAAVTTGEGENTRTVSFTQIGYKNVLKLTLDENGAILSVVILQ